MISREVAGYIFGILVIAVAAIGGYYGFLSSEHVFMLVLIGLALAGLGRFRGKDFETVLFRALRAGRKVQPLVAIDRRAGVVKVWTLEGQVPRGLRKLIEKVGDLLHYRVEFHSHSGFVLVANDEWKKIAENPALHGPEYSGETDTVDIGVGPRLVKVVLRHVKFLAARRWVGFGPKAGGMWLGYDGVIREGEVQEFYFSVPTHDGLGKPIEEGWREGQAVISSIAFRDTPAVLAYEVYVKDVGIELGEKGLLMAYVKGPGISSAWTYPRSFYPRETGRYRVTNTSQYPVRVNLAYKQAFAGIRKFFVALFNLFYRGRFAVVVEKVLSPGTSVDFTIDELDLKWPVELEVTSAVKGQVWSYGYVKIEKVVVEEPKPQPPVGEVMYVMSGDEIRPDAEPWVGSAGHAIDRTLLTNAHVAPQEGQTVYVNYQRSGKWRRVGTVTKVAEIKTVSFIHIFLNWLFGIKLPANKVDAAAVAMADGVEYQKFVQYPDTVYSPMAGESVESRGRTSGVRSGTVEADEVTVMVPWPHKNHEPAIFEDVYLLDMETRPGDSGSAVVSKRGWVGLIFAGDQSGKIGLAIKAKNIMDWLNSGGQ